MRTSPRHGRRHRAPRASRRRDTTRSTALDTGHRGSPPRAAALRELGLVLAGLVAAGSGPLLLLRAVEQARVLTETPAPRVDDVMTTLAAGTAGVLLLWALLTGGASVLVLVLQRRGRRWAPLEAVERRVVPALVRRLVVAGLGATVAAGIATPAALAVTTPAAVSATTASTGSPADLAAPVPAWPAETAETPSTPSPSTLSPGTRPPGDAERVEVAAGDSLWSLAAEHLGTGAGDHAVAEEWPRWWAANREIIGEDPDVIRPGQVLQAPGGTR